MSKGGEGGESLPGDSESGIPGSSGAGQSDTGVSAERLWLRLPKWGEGHSG